MINSPIFGIERIRVEGARELAESEVRALAGVEPGANLLRLSLDEVVTSVERSPWVRRAVADRSLPSTLVLRIAERRPVGWIDDPSGVAVVAADGTVVTRAASARPDLPGLGTLSATVEPGERLDGVTTLRVAASMDDDLLASVASVGVVDGELVMELRDGGTVAYGPPEGLREKNRALAGMLAWAGERGLGIDSIDVRVPAAPALRPSTG